MVDFEFAVSIDIKLQHFGEKYCASVSDTGRLNTDRAAEDFLKDICDSHPEISYDNEIKFYLGITGRS